MGETRSRENRGIRCSGRESRRGQGEGGRDRRWWEEWQEGRRGEERRFMDRWVMEILREGTGGGEGGGGETGIHGEVVR